jgi:hypothetical protein
VSARPSSTVGPPSAPLEPTGVAGRVNDLVAAARHVPGAAAGEELLARAQRRLTRPLTVAVVPVRDAVRERCEELVSLVAGEADARVTVDTDDVATSDLFVLVGDDDLDAASVDGWLRRLQAGRAGPVALGVVVDAANRDAEVITRSLRSSRAGSAIGQVGTPELAAATLRSVCQELTGQRLTVLQASAALPALIAGLDQMPPSTSRAAVHESIESLRGEVPALEELELLREVTAGRALLPMWLRGPLHSLLLFSDAARRLQLEPGATPGQLKSAVVALGSEWRTHENSGRLPFTARRAALVAQRSLDQLYAELAPYG